MRYILKNRMLSRGYRNYLRYENIKALLDNKYKIDYSYSTYLYSCDLTNTWLNYYDNRCPRCDRLKFEIQCDECGYREELI
jgi:hypothetical protein